MENHQDSQALSRTSAPYGQSCIECSQSKTKCIRLGNRPACERCERLKRDCRPSATNRRRNMKRPSTSRVNQLEQKLEKVDRLIAHLENGTHSDLFANSANNGDRSSTSPASFSETTGTSSVVSSALTPNSTESDKLLNNPLLISSIEAQEPSATEAEQYLTIFQTQKIQYFPFVVVSSTSQQLREERPFLWLCIMTVASPSTSQQQTLGDQVRRTLAQEMMLGSQHNIDLLQGLLVYLAWSNYQTSHKSSLSTLCQLAISLVHDMGLNQAVTKENPLAALCINKSEHPPPTVARTTEERRAALGCFFITSVIATFLQRIDALRWTSHLEESLEHIAQAQVSPNDQILVPLVRMQLIAERFSEYSSATENHLPSNQAALPFYQTALQSQLEKLQSSINPGVKYNEAILLHAHAISLMISSQPLFQSPTPLSGSAQYSLQQITSLQNALASIEAWFSSFALIPPAAYIGFPFSTFSQLVRCLITLYRLSTLEDPSWNKNAVKERLDVLKRLDEVIASMDMVAGQAGLDINETMASNRQVWQAVRADVFSRTARTFRAIRPVWEAALSDNGGTGTQGFDHFGGETLDIPMQGDPFNNDWLSDLFLLPS